MTRTAPSPRRQFIIALSSYAASMAVPSHAKTLVATKPDAQLVRKFSALCNTLAGTKIENDTLVAQYVEVLTQSIKPSQWQALLALTRLTPAEQAKASLGKPLRQVSDLALQLWLSATTLDHRVLSYVEAPVWSTLTFTKPPGVCGGAFGYWAEKPAT